MTWRASICVAFFAGCSAVTTIPKAEPTGFLVFELSPDNADILIDEKYVGTADAFPQGLTVPAGHRRVMIRMQGYETERFDIEIQSGEEVTLELQLVASIEMDDEEPTPRRSFLREAKARP